MTALAPPATTAEIGALRLLLVSAVTRCDAAMRPSQFLTLADYRLAWRVHLECELRALQARFPSVCWAQRTDGGWWFRALDHRTTASETLGLAVGKWIETSAAELRA
jgi:hypothetical protein